MGAPLACGRGRSNRATPSPDRAWSGAAALRRVSVRWRPLRLCSSTAVHTRGRSLARGSAPARSPSALSTMRYASLLAPSARPSCHSPVYRLGVREKKPQWRHERAGAGLRDNSPQATSGRSKSVRMRAWGRLELEVAQVRHDKGVLVVPLAARAQQQLRAAWVHIRTRTRSHVHRRARQQQRFQLELHVQRGERPQIRQLQVVSVEIGARDLRGWRVGGVSRRGERTGVLRGEVVSFAAQSALTSAAPNPPSQPARSPTPAHPNSSTPPLASAGPSNPALEPQPFRPNPFTLPRPATPPARRC